MHALTRLTMAGVLGTLCLALPPTASAAAPTGDVRLTGAGSTFVGPLCKKWVVDFEQATTATPALSGGSIAKIDYNSTGSGNGIKAITDKTVAFACSDAPLSKKELEALGGAAKVVQVPVCAGGVVPAYNLEGIKDEIHFTGDLLAKIFQGKVSKWNDAAVAAINPGVTLPALTITPAYRTDGSGTTFVFTNFLAGQSEDFKGSIGTGKQVQWPTGQGGKGNEGVAAVVQQTKGALGYIELNYALANKIAFGSVKNAGGKFVKASIDSISAAGASAADKLSETKGSTVLAANIWNQPGDAAYPISAFVYAIVYKDLDNLKSAEEAKALATFLRWTTTDDASTDGKSGQAIAKSLDYAPLAPDVQKKVADALGTLTYNGAPVK